MRLVQDFSPIPPLMYTRYTSECAEGEIQARIAPSMLAWTSRGRDMSGPLLGLLVRSRYVSNLHFFALNKKSKDNPRPPVPAMYTLKKSHGIGYVPSKLWEVFHVLEAKFRHESPPGYLHGLGILNLVTLSPFIKGVFAKVHTKLALIL